MSYQIYYPTPCEGTLPDHITDGCDGDNIEHARIRSIGFVYDSIAATIETDLSDPAPWKAGIVEKQVIIVPETQGSLDSAEVTGPGYGDESERLIGYNHTVTFRDPNYKQNSAFYNSIKFSRSLRLAYRTETQTHLSGKTVKVIPKAVIADDLTGEVVWEVTVKWFEADIPAPADTPPGVFLPFQYV